MPPHGTYLQSTLPTVNIETVLSEIERNYFFQLWQFVSNGATTDKRLIEFLGRSGLPKPILKDLWSKYADNSMNLNRMQFFTYLRAIAMSQNNIPIEQHPSLMLSRQFPFLPLIQGIQCPQLPRPQTLNPTHLNTAFPAISQDDLANYERMVETVVSANSRPKQTSRESFERTKPETSSASRSSKKKTSRGSGTSATETKTHESPDRKAS